MKKTLNFNKVYTNINKSLEFITKTKLIFFSVARGCGSDVGGVRLPDRAGVPRRRALRRGRRVRRRAERDDQDGGGDHAGDAHRGLVNP